MIEDLTQCRLNICFIIIVEIIKACAEVLTDALDRCLGILAKVDDFLGVLGEWRESGTDGNAFLTEEIELLK